MQKNKTTLLLIIFNVLFGSANEYVDAIQFFLDNGAYDKANDEFILALKEYDANAKIYFIGGQAAIKLDKLDEANKHIIKAIELDNKNEEFRNSQQNLEKLKNLLTSARKTYDSGNIDDAIIEHEKIITAFPDYAIVYYNLGRIYKVDQKYDSAYFNYKKACELNPFEEKYSKAIVAIAQEMASNGDIEYRRQEFVSAIEYYKNAIQYVSTYTTAIFKLARTYFKIKDYINAKIYLEQNLAINPNQEQSEKMLGDIYRKMDQTDSAIHHYNNAISINTKYSKAHYSLGTILLNNGDLTEARKELNVAIMIDPNYEKAYIALGKVEQELGNLDLAVMNYIKTTEIAPKLYDVHYRLASVYNIKKQYEDAKISAKNCLNIKRNYAPAYFELGVSEKALGNKIAAINAFENAKKDQNWRKSAQFELDMLNRGM